MKIELGESYATQGGHKARIICIDRLDTKYPVLALVLTGAFEDVRAYTHDGVSSDSSATRLRLISPWTDLKVGQLVFVGGDAAHMPHVMRFDGITEGKRFRVLNAYGQLEIWHYCRAVTVEDLQ